MKTETKPKKKKQKLLVQVGLVNILYSLLSVAVTCLLIYFACIFVYLRTKEDQLSQNLHRIGDYFFTKDYTVTVSPVAIRYLSDHPEICDYVVSGDIFRISSNDYPEEYYEYVEPWIDMEDTSGMYDDMPENLLGVVVPGLYMSFLLDLFDEQDNNRYKEIRVINAMEGHVGQILFWADDRDRDYFDNYLDARSDWGRNYMERSGIGRYMEEGIGAHPELQKLIETKGRDAVFEENMRDEANESLTGYYPVYVKGELCLVLALTYDWSDVQDRVGERVSWVFVMAFLLNLIIQFFLLVHMYFISVRPLQKVKRSLTAYIDSKDSDAVVKDMENVWQRNEFGLLAEDISAMVREIDRYTHENMELAGDRKKAATELELAARIQNGILRRDFPHTPEYDIYALMDPAREVGGDFYDFFEVDATHLALVIADVAGKGVPGSLFMMSALTIIRGKTLPGIAPSDILTGVNDELLKGDFGDMFVTIWMGILDLESGIVTAANAGHEYPMIRTGDRFRMMKDKHGFVVGGMPGVRYTDYEIDLSRGGTLFVYTDGLPEATAADDELYGTDRIVESLNRDPMLQPRELVEHAKMEVDIFVGDAEQFDDLTILCVSYHPSAFRV